MPILTTAQKARYDDIASKTLVDAKELNEAVISTFSGTDEPLPSLGKEMDVYKRYPSDTPVVVMDEAAYEGYDANRIFYAFIDNNTEGLQKIGFSVTAGALILFYGSDGMPDEHDYKLQIDSGTIHDLTVATSNGALLMLDYPPAAVIDVSGITDQSNIRIASAQLSGKFQDYVKYSDLWFPTIPYSRVEVTHPFDNATPTLIELTIGFGLAEHHDWAHDHKFYIKNSHGLYIITYRANGDTAIGGTNYRFYWELLTEAV